MKKFVTLFASVMLVSMSINAQEQGKFYVGGYAGLSASGTALTLSDGYDTTGGTTVQANLGYATLTSVGGAINYQGDTLSLNTAVFATTLGLSPSVTFKYYF